MSGVEIGGTKRSGVTDYETYLTLSEERANNPKKKYMYKKRNKRSSRKSYGKRKTRKNYSYTVARGGIRL